MKIINAGCRKYILYSIAGRAALYNKAVKNISAFETIKHTGLNRPTFTIPIIVQTTVADYDRLFIKDGSNVYHAVQSTGFDILCQENDEVVAVWAVAKKQTRGPYIALRNNSTGQAFFNTAALKNMYHLPWPYGVFIAVVAGSIIFLLTNWIIGTFGFFSCLLLTWLILLRIANIKTHRFMDRFNFEV